MHRIPAAALPPQTQKQKEKEGQDVVAQQCEAFLAQSFERKEAALRQFYVEGVPLQESRGKEQEQGQKQHDRGYARAARAAYASGLLCMGLTTAAVVALGRSLSPLLFWGYVAVVTGLTLVVIHRFEGWDSLELRLDGGGEKGKDT